MASGMQSHKKLNAYLSQNLKFQICREAGIKFFSGDIFGFFGYCFMDLIDHEYVEEITKVRHSLNYLPWLMVLSTVGIVFKWSKRGWMPNGPIKCHLNITEQMDATLFS